MSQQKNHPETKDTKKKEKKIHPMVEAERTTSGYGSIHRHRRSNVSPLDSDLSELPSEKRLNR